MTLSVTKDVVEEQASNDSVGDVFEIMEQDGSVKELPSVLQYTKWPLHISWLLPAMKCTSILSL
jgi:hypothetical protein